MGLLWNPSISVAADENLSSADDPDFKLQGEYAGEIKTPSEDGESIPIGVHVSVLGDEEIRTTDYLGGFPGAGWNGVDRYDVEGIWSDGKLKMRAGKDDRVQGQFKNDVLQIKRPDDKVAGELKRIERQSPTLGAAAPEGAVVLFDGKSVEQFNPGKITSDGLLAEGATSRRAFQSYHLHVEFLLPYMPKARGQGRGNSRCYLQSRYEVQVLDSFGLKGEMGECGGIYGIMAPDVNTRLPPLAWQTDDIDYSAAKFEGDKKIRDAMMTVKHNGVVVHNDVPLPHATTAAPLPEGPAPGPIPLQDHGNPVRYRNVWIVEKP